ncbi:hypothetical protein B6D60_06115 [candidate division KSB1 bacterium 4484_87]|nr:MAG: hypothetical protein B6D60_06115 [candidate division KSB1 bacterium 4484_87]
MRKNHYKHREQPISVRRRKELDEYLEILWYVKEKEGKIEKELVKKIESDWDPSIAEVLRSQGLIEETDSEFLFTETGYNRTRQIVRSHRLAERLLTDVLKMPIDSAETGACEFEHNVVPEIVDGICTLLGHPRVCPHGLPIPEGDCCREARRQMETATKNLTELKPGQKASIVYINTQSNERMHQLTRLGVRPGATLHLHQIYPALVIRIGSQQIAIDERIAKDIQVWVKNGED